MQLEEKTQFVLSEDTLTDPKLVRLSEDADEVDITLLTRLVEREEAFPVGTNVINMGALTQGRWLYVKPDADVGLILNGGSTITFRGGKRSKMWINFTSLSVVVSGSAANVLIAIAGA